jgi:uncharacterized protein (TIGR02145 family)
MKKNQFRIKYSRVFIFFLMIFSGNTLLSQNNQTISPTVTIGSQKWMAENLDVDTFRNGEKIPEAKTNEQWEAAYKSQKAAWCYYNNNPDNGKRFGRLYNWYAVNDSRGLAPDGMHIPSHIEWQTLVINLGGESVAFSKMKSSTGFSALPGGERYYLDCSFLKMGEIGFWWSSTKQDSYNAWYHALHFGYSQVGTDNGGMNTGFSVRCVID